MPFSITESDILIPDSCPVLGIPIFRGSGRPGDNSPTVDAIIPRLGYIPGNIAVISLRANRIKNDASFEELEMVAKWLRQATIRPKL